MKNRTQALIASAVACTCCIAVRAEEPLFRNADILIKGSAAVKRDGSMDADASSGMRLAFRDCIVCFYDAPVPQYGISLSLPCTAPVSLTVQAGTVRPDGSFARLASPQLAPSVSPFSRFCPGRMGMTTSLPSSASRNRLPSLSVMLSPSRGTGALDRSNAALLFREDGSFALSASLFRQYSGALSAGLSVTGGRFLISESVSRWFSPVPLFAPAWCRAILCETVFASPFLASRFSIHAYEQPDSSVRYTLRSENCLTAGVFSAVFSFFLADGNAIRFPDSRLLETTFQAHAAPACTFSLGPGSGASLSAGLSFSFQRAYDVQTAGRTDTMKYGFGTLYSGRHIAARSILTFGESRLTVNTGIRAGNGIFHAGMTAGLVLSGQDAKETVSASVYLRTDLLSVSCSSGVTIEQESLSWTGGTAFLRLSVRTDISCVRCTAAGKAGLTY